MNTPRAGEAHQVGKDELQTCQVQITGFEKRQSLRQALEGTKIPSINEKPVKSLGKLFDNSLRDATAIQKSNELEPCLQQSGQA